MLIPCQGLAQKSEGAAVVSVAMASCQHSFIPYSVGGRGRAVFTRNSTAAARAAEQTSLCLCVQSSHPTFHTRTLFMGGRSRSPSPRGDRDRDRRSPPRHNSSSRHRGEDDPSHSKDSRHHSSDRDRSHRDRHREEDRDREPLWNGDSSRDRDRDPYDRHSDRSKGQPDRSSSRWDQPDGRNGHSSRDDRREPPPQQQQQPPQHADWGRPPPPRPRQHSRWVK